MRLRGIGWGASSALALMAMAPPAIAAKPAEATPTPTAASSLQQRFDAASAATDRHDCATALPIFESLAGDPRVKPGTLAAGTIAVRRGVCLFSTGRQDEAEPEILAGLPILLKAGPDMQIDAALGEETLGNIAMRRHDHDDAVVHFKAAAALVGESTRVRLLVNLAKATQFDGGSQPLAYLDEALRITSAQPKPDRASLAAIHAVRGRILMNQGQNKQALVELKQALSLSGGLTSTISLAEASMRFDLAQAALLNGDKDNARLYLAYTGAGRIESSPFAVAASMAPPQCGPETGLSPDDSAVVEFGIDAAGDVPTASTVYTRGDYAVASAFARAVEQWFWRPDALAKIPPFYKVLTRVELRCSVSGGRMPGVVAPLRERVATWSRPYLGGTDFETAKTGSSLDQLATMAKEREAAGDLPGAVAALMTRGAFDPDQGSSAFDDFDEAVYLATKAQLPTDIIDAAWVFRKDAEQRKGHYTPRRRPNRSADDAATQRSAPTTLTGDALANDTLLLLTTPETAVGPRYANTMATLGYVADDQRLPDHHPLRQVALLRLANLAASQGKLDEAHGYFSRTGLSEEQCSLIGVQPAMKSSGASSSDFPMEAMRYGFEGWVNIEFDINANGTTAHARPLIAYPPFVFVDAATGMSRGIRYQASYRPTDKLACSARRETINFHIQQ